MADPKSGREVEPASGRAPASPRQPPSRPQRGDVALAVALAVLAAAGSLAGTCRTRGVVFRTSDRWFESDCARVFYNMTDARSRQSRTAVHPLFPLLAHPPAAVLQGVLGLAPEAAVQGVLAAVASLCAVAFFALVRLVGCRRGDAALLTLLLASSAAAIFWFTVPETYPFGLLTILVALVVVALAERRGVSGAWYVAASALTLSVTVTNWMVGIAAAFAGLRWRRAVAATAAALCVVAALSVVQSGLFPGVRFFPAPREEARHVFTAESGGPAGVFQSVLFHGMVMPELGVRRDASGELILTVQASPPGSASLVGAAGVAVWVALLAVGFWAFLRAKRHGPLRLVVGVSLLGQLLLHVAYGEETFLYALHFVPLLLVVVAFGALARVRRLVLALAVALVVLAAINNVAQFGRAVSPFARALRPLAGHGLRGYGGGAVRLVP